MSGNVEMMEKYHGDMEMTSSIQSGVDSTLLTTNCYARYTEEGMLVVWTTESSRYMIAC